MHARACICVCVCVRMCVHNCCCWHSTRPTSAGAPEMHGQTALLATSSTYSGNRKALENNHLAPASNQIEPDEGQAVPLLHLTLNLARTERCSRYSMHGTSMSSAVRAMPITPPLPPCVCVHRGPAEHAFPAVQQSMPFQQSNRACLFSSPTETFSAQQSMPSKACLSSSPTPPCSFACSSSGRVRAHAHTDKLVLFTVKSNTCTVRCDWT